MNCVHAIFGIWRWDDILFDYHLNAKHEQVERKKKIGDTTSNNLFDI